MPLVNNFRVRRGQYTFLYLARQHRFQVYKGGLTHFGAPDPLHEHLDETKAVFATRADAEPLIEQFIADGNEEF